MLYIYQFIQLIWDNFFTITIPVLNITTGGLALGIFAIKIVIKYLSQFTDVSLSIFNGNNDKYKQKKGGKK